MAPRALDRIAVLSVHSHGDRSFLDDSDLALLSGDLRGAGLGSDLVAVALWGVDDPSFEALVSVLAEYDAVVFGRVFSRAIVERLRERVPGRVWIHSRGEHELADAPAEWISGPDMRRSVLGIVEHLRGERPRPPNGTRERVGEGWTQHDASSLEKPRDLVYRPNLRPRLVNAEAFPRSRTHSILGNIGCPYQADARENPAYAGVHIPEGVGRGCAFCTTGNHYLGRPSRETAAFVLEQLRYVRTTAPELDRVVLKDQNPFAYLTEVVEAAGRERLGPFTLMLETRADWLRRSESRFEVALEAARAGGLRLVPFLVGIENFSQPELDRYNKGTTAEANVSFLEWLWELRERFGETLDLASASFGFVLFSPWTTLADLETNHRAIVRTRLDRLRGKLLHSRARLYPDTALYYLAERDGLFAESFHEGQDASKRYGYFPARPWRYADPTTERFAALATEVVDRMGGRDEVRVFGTLLEAFRREDPRTLTAESILAELNAPPADEAMRRRFERLVRPLSFDARFGDGWTIRALERTERGLRVRVHHEREAPLVVEIVPHRDGPRDARSRHYDLRALGAPLTSAQKGALSELTAAITTNDR